MKRSSIATFALLLTLTGCGIPEKIQAALRSPEETTKQYLTAVQMKNETAVDALSEPLTVGDCQDNVAIDLSKALTGFLGEFLPLTSYELGSSQTQENFAVVQVKLSRTNGLISANTSNVVILDRTKGEWLVVGLIPARDQNAQQLLDSLKQQKNCTP